MQLLYPLESHADASAIFVVCCFSPSADDDFIQIDWIKLILIGGKMGKEVTSFPVSV